MAQLLAIVLIESSACPSIIILGARQSRLFCVMMKAKKINYVQLRLNTVFLLITNSLINKTIVFNAVVSWSDIFTTKIGVKVYEYGFCGIQRQFN